MDAKGVPAVYRCHGDASTGFPNLFQGGAFGKEADPAALKGFDYNLIQKPARIRVDLKEKK